MDMTTLPRIVLGGGLTATAAVIAALSLVGSGPAPDGSLPYVVAAGSGHRPQDMALTAYASCDALLAGLRSHTAQQFTEDGPYGQIYHPGYGAANAPALGAPMPVAAAVAPSAATSSVPAHSTTNDQELGVDEPDIVKSDGRRIVTVSDGVLRVVDAVTHKITGTLDLGEYAGAGQAQLLMAGNRVLVILGGYAGGIVTPYLTRPILAPGGPVAVDPGLAVSPGGVSVPVPANPVVPAPAQPVTGQGSTVLLVDIAHAPTVLGTLHTDGSYLDARFARGTARLVVQSTPHLPLPQPSSRQTVRQQLAAERAAVEHAPLFTWLPSYTVTVHGTTTTHTVPCQDVGHPKTYTGMSLLTVYSIDLAGSLADPEPITLAADGATVYASTSSLYIASTDGTRTQLHRFDITHAGRPSYLGSGSVAGQLLDPYSMSEYDGMLRVVTTTAASTGVTILNATTLHTVGYVGGLGPGENLHAVRFLGPLAYVVTYRSVDPLYVLDLRDPAHPRKAGELTVTGYSDYLHPTAAGRLLGVGEDVNDQQRVTGLQVSLFDVHDPAHPTRLARVVRTNTPSETPIDPHAFLYWPATGTAVVPIDSWNESGSGVALVLHVGTAGLRVEGTIDNPGSSAGSIERTLVIGDELWTLSPSGLQANDLATLHRAAWLPFS
jgi:Secreted protein containing C-terminal beta-propeller domain distantly related to WD-40 repeats